MKRIRLAVADNSLFIREAVARMLSREPRIELVGLAATAEELLANLERWRPDVITLELSMPGMGGLAALDQIMATRPTPVIVFSTHSGTDAPLALDALDRGAVDFVDKQAYSRVDFQALRPVLIEKILAAAQATPRAVAGPQSGDEAGGGWEADARGGPGRATGPGCHEIVLIGASTGGPPAIEWVLRELGREVPVPVAVVQHMPEGFTRAFADRLAKNLLLDVREASHGETLRPATVRVGPAGMHLRIETRREGMVSVLTRSPSRELHRPSVDILFASAAESVGAGTLAVLLTGMGRDGAQGMARLVAAGAYTIAQDKSSSVVYGMPRAAVELNAAREVLPLPLIGHRVRQLLEGVGRG
ncbi:MAG: chemotaxis-specific protein-glutamate methyltransferase CheB [Gemmatimonadetes bacterium]|nr:chemotaxis-specific protein-glutamate methyltransferase CheB [Gemmatimonadota bacterium]